MSEEQKATSEEEVKEEGVDQEAPKEDGPQDLDEQTPEQKEQEEVIKGASKFMLEIFDEIVMKSDLTFEQLEIIPQLLTGRISMLKGQSKLWGKCEAVKKDFYLTKVKELELYNYEDDKENKNEA